MRDLMRLVVERGTGRRAAVPGIAIGGKTGTALKEESGGYTHKVINSFLAVFPIDDPKYLLLVTLDEPQATDGKPDESAWNAAPAAGAILKRVAPMLDLLPERQFDEAVVSPYEKQNSAGDRQIFSRNHADEARGSDERRPAYGRSPSFERSRNYGVD
jgi:cell division protein FtsI (penicillin-binding protein 3)